MSKELKTKIEELREKGYVIPDTAVSVNDDGTWKDAEGIEHAAKKEDAISKAPVGLIVGIVIAILALIVGGYFAWTYLVDHTKQTSHVEILEAGDTFTFNPNDYFAGLAEDVTASDFTVKEDVLDTTKPGDYLIPVTYKSKEYEIAVRVEDTIAPEVTVVNDYVITNNAKELTAEDFIEYSDITECTVNLGRYEKISDLQIVTDEVIAEMKEGLQTSGDVNALLEREEYIPESGKLDINGNVKEETAEESTEETEESTEEETLDEEVSKNYVSHEEDGIYSAIIEVTDTSKNTTVKEVIVVYDTTAPELYLADDTVASFEDVTVEQKDVTAEPTYDMQDATVYDSVDGKYEEDEYTLSIAETDAENHVWTVTVKASDRAGNEMEESYTITVKEKKEEKKKPATTSSSSSNTSSSDTSASTGNDTASAGNASSSSASQSSTAGVISLGGDHYEMYYNNDRVFWVDGEPSASEVAFAKKMLDAGLGVPVLCDDGRSYAMLVSGSLSNMEKYVENGKLRAHIESLGYSVTGGYGYNFSDNTYIFIMTF